MSPGFLIAAPQSGSGKTTVTLGLLRAFSQDGVGLQSAKAGPDFIDPAFHRFATGQDCINLDPWAMQPDYLQTLVQPGPNTLVVEAMMGLFDGGADGSGSAADLAKILNLPVVLVVDAAKQSHSIAALVGGFKKYRGDINVAGVILNRVGSVRHETMLREALDLIKVPVFGCVSRDEKLALPSRHLGLVQAQEHQDIETFIDGAAAIMRQSIDTEALLALAAQGNKIQMLSTAGSRLCLPPLGQKIAIAQDRAFAFLYPHLLTDWRKHGAELSFFSPLEDEAPATGCDAVFIPGGYPELHAGQLAQNSTFFDGLRRAATDGVFVYGECGGFMVLGKAIVDADGKSHEMANLLPLVTSFKNRKLHLGYRLARPHADFPLAQKNQVLTAHEFHYTSVVNQGEVAPLFSVEDARGEDLGSCGMRMGNVAGSYMHIIHRR